MAAVSTKKKRGPLDIRRLPVKLDRDDRRVIARLFVLGGEGHLHAIIDRVSGLSDETVADNLGQVLRNFQGRHENIAKIFEAHFQMVADLVGWQGDLSGERRLLVGSYFTMEYSIEAAALFNPSIVGHPDQSGLPEGSLRFIMSLRATGEGHLSSVVFRTGTLDRDNRVLVDPATRFSSALQRAPDQHYLRPLFRKKLDEMAANASTADRVLDPLPEQFTYAQLKEAVAHARRADYKPPFFAETVESIFWLARSNYQLKLAPDADVSEIVLFPQSDNEARGIEDLRLVRFIDDDGTVSYFGTYTAYNGFRNLPMLMETKDFRTIEIHTLNGACARDKGLALFPRRVGGHYVMCSRIDGHSLYIMYSDYVHFWESAERLAVPLYPWEMMLMGNCGSPLETEAGWLLITHGVGPMRRYCIGAMLLELDDPLKVIGRLREPLLAPSEAEREGYVPNVVYSCGSVLHNGRLYIPYAMSDTATSMASVDADDLINRLLDSPA